MSVTWSNVQVTLGELKPWADNPRLSSKRQAQRLLDSWRQFGQVQTVAIGPQNEVYDGHQRLSALLTVHGPSYQVDARRCSRELTDEERRALVVTLHAGAVGSWDWDSLSGWDAGLLQEWGFDSDTLRTWYHDAGALGNLLKNEAPDEWQGMPEFEQEDRRAFRSIIVHFENQNAVEEFARLINQTITNKTKSIWHPYKPADVLKNIGYKDES